MIYEKLLKAQKEIGAIKKDSDNPYFKSKYFDINGILAVVKPVLNNNGLILTQGLKTRQFDGDVTKTGIETIIADVDTRETIETFCEFPLGTDPQKTGSAITYFRRYSLQSLLALEAEDDDGNAASGKEKVKKAKPIGDNEVPFASEGDAPGTVVAED